MLRFDHIRAHNVGPFSDVDVDLSALPAVVAVVGANGAGKSTFLELLAGALFRSCPTRGPLTGLARGRDSWLEVRAKNGTSWTMRHQLDAVSGKSEAVVLDENGKPAFADAKVREFDRWAGAHLPSSEVLYSSTFGVQGSAGFLALKPAERKAVLLRVLGIERFELLAERARERARNARDEHTLAVARLSEVSGISMAAASEARAAAIVAELDAANLVAKARAELDEARGVAAMIEEALRTRRERSEAFDRLASRADRLRDEIGSSETRIANNRDLVARAEEIRSAVARRAEMGERHRGLVDAASARQADAARHQTDAARAERQIADLGRRTTELDVRRRAAQLAAVARVGLDCAIADEPRLIAADSEARALLETAELRERELAAASLTTSEGRVRYLRGALDLIAHAPSTLDLREEAATALLIDQAAADAAAAAPTARAAASADVQAARAVVTAAARVLADCQRAIAGRGAIEAAERDIVRIGDERVAIAQEMTTAEMEVASARRAVEAEMVKAASARREARALEAEMLEVDSVAKLVERLAQAEARIEELQSGIARARGELAEIEAQAAAMGTDDAADLPAVPDLEGMERSLRTHDAQHRAAVGALAVAERDVEAAGARDARRAELEANRDRIAVALADWTRLAGDLGKDGIQALEIDAAGPELSALANDLLHTCVGSRWTVTVDTQRTAADGRLLESLEVRVLDTVGGRDAPVETYSGGERVLIGEAVSLALAMLSCRRSGQRDVTLVRDESGAALDGDKARAYVAMLRRAVQLTGARQVLLVTHAPEVADLCDARLHIEGGKVEVRA